MTMLKKHYWIVMLSVVFMVGVAEAAAKLGVVWSGKSGMTKRVVAGMEEGLKELAPDIEIEWQKELADMDALGTVVERYQKEKDGMVVLRSSGAKYLIKNAPTIPAFIGGCSSPVGLGVVQNMDQPEGNITGVTYTLSAATQFETFMAIVPEIESVMLLLEEGHPGSTIDQQQTKVFCEGAGIQYSDSFIKPGASDEETAQAVTAAVQGVQGKVSAIIIGSQALVMDSTALIVSEAGNTPVFSYSQKPVKDGAVCGLAADDHKLGRLLAESIADALVNGKSIASIPIKVDNKPQLYINVKTAEQIALEIPFDILSVAKVLGMEGDQVASK